MKIDTFLKIGHSHTLCQDYILAGDDPCPFIIVSDGCSQAKDSDIGARILCHSALEYLKENQSNLDRLNEYQMGEDIIRQAKLVQSYYQTNIDCLDATLIIAFRFNKDLYVYMYGDGVVYAESMYDTIYYYRRYYKPNAPAYLRYHIHGFEKYNSQNVASFLDYNHRCHQVEDNVMEPWFHRFADGDIRTLIIGTDGVESFIFKQELLYKTLYISLLNEILSSATTIGTDPNKFVPEIKELDFLDVLKEINQFKNTSGVFVKRRMKKVIKEYLKKGFVNDDDLAIGCFYLEEYHELSDQGEG